MPIVKVRDRGPIVIELKEGESLELFDGQNRLFGLGERRVVSFCRCGASQNKPFCDGSHRTADFDSCVEARDLPPARTG